MHSACIREGWVVYGYVLLGSENCGVVQAQNCGTE
jgi:hypothetical protein